MSHVPVYRYRLRYRSIFHKLAMASVVLSSLALLLYPVVFGAVWWFGPLSGERVRLAWGSVVGVIAVASLIAGGIALLGTLRHGARRLLGRALFGVITPLVMIAVALPLFWKSLRRVQDSVLEDPGITAHSLSFPSAGSEVKKDVETEIAELADRLTRRGPQEVSPDLRIDRVEAKPGRTLVYYYTVVGSPYQDGAIAGFKELVRERLEGAYRTDPEVQFQREYGVTLLHRYRDSDGNLLFELSTGPDLLMSETFPPMPKLR